MRILIAGRREDGAVAITVALLAVILVVLVAFTTDFGMAYAQRRALSTGADSAALAVVRAEYNTQMTSLTRTCLQAKKQDDELGPDDPKKAENIALAQVNANAPFGATIPKSAIDTKLSCEGEDLGILQVRVKVNRTITPIFGGVVSASDMQISREAVAVLEASASVGNLVPIALCSDQASELIKNWTEGTPPPYPLERVPLSKDWGSSSMCGERDGAGNWGWLQFPGQPPGEPGLRDAIASHNGTLTLSGTPASYSITGSPGNVDNGTPVTNGLKALIIGPAAAPFTDPIDVTFPIFESGTIDRSGRNATYHVIGFLSAQICGYDATTVGPYDTIEGHCYEDVPGLALTGNDMQIRYVNYIEAKPGEAPCGMGDPACAFSAYATGLVG